MSKLPGIIYSVAWSDFSDSSMVILCENAWRVLALNALNKKFESYQKISFCAPATKIPNFLTTLLKIKTSHRVIRE
jgi:hypothetical protein